MASDPGGADSGIGGGKGVCSICIEAVETGGDRSIAQLFCGHVFHLDCIGSAFNVKGEMQCPNCRKVENGSWRFAKGGRSYSDVNSRQWIEEDFDFTPDVPLSFHWYPFGRPLHAPSSSEGLDSSSATSHHHGIPGFPPGIFPENMVRNALDICPYVAYFQFFYPSSASSHISSGNPSNGTSFRHHQSRRRRSTEVRHSHNHHNQENTYDGWNHSFFVHGPPYSSHSIDAGQASTHAPPLRSMFGADDPFSQVRPHHGFDQSSGPRSGSSASSNVSMDTANNLQEHHYQYESWNRFNDSFFSGVHQSGNSRSVAPIGPSHNSSNDPDYQLFGHGSSTGAIVHGLESCPGGSRHYAWDGAPFSSAPPVIADEWGIRQYSSSASGPTSGADRFWYGHDVERTLQEGRTESSSYGQCTGPHIHQFI